jgi:YD repeat-containing protein
VNSIKDRNGNTVSFQYLDIKINGEWFTTTLVTQVTDPLGRHINIVYEDPNDPLAPGCDRITFPGAGGPDRTIRVCRQHVENALRNSYSAGTILFDEIDDYTVSHYGLWAPTRVILPDSREYQFQYNPYAEVARVVLPTGGAIEYDHGAGVVPDAGKGVFTSGQLMSAIPFNREASVPTPPWQPGIYRRLLLRRVYLNASDTTPIGTTSYPQFEHAATATENPTGVFYNVGIERDPYASVERTGQGIAPGAPVVSRHYFHIGDPSVWGMNRSNLGPAANLLYQQEPQGYGDSFEGREYKTETPDLQLVTRVYGLPNPPRRILEVCQQNTTLLDTGATSGKLFFYEPAFLNLTDLYEFDYGSAPAIQTAPGANGNYNICPSSHPSTGFTRHVQTEYVASTDYTGSDAGQAHLRNLPSAVKVYDGATVKAETHYYYDQQTNGTECNYQPGLADAAGVTQHDAAYGSGFATRGNLKCTARWRNLPSTEWLVTKNRHDIVGNVVLTQDPRGNSTQYSYATSCSSGPSNTYAFPTQATNALGHTVSTRYDCWLGKPDQITDSNNAVTTLAYNDSLDRLTSANEADVRQTGYVYSTSPPAVDITAAGVHSRLEYDGLGRQTASILYDGGTTVSQTDTQYDGLGRVWKVSNPHTGTATEWTTITYDALNRATAVQAPDGATTSTAYSGNYATVTDPAGKARKNTTDALGRLTEVVENPGGSPAYTTSYTYDALDNLTQVSQPGQPRNFTYDSLGIR